MLGPMVEDEQHLASVKEQQQNLQNDEPIVEDANDEDDEDDDEGDDKDQRGADGAGGNESSKQSRSEKKSRKAMLKLGMKPVTGVSRVTIKRTKMQAKIEDLSSQLQRQAAQQFRMPDISSMMAKPDVSAAAQADEEEEEVDDTGVEPRDIDLVMTQAGVSRSKAVKALKTHNGDIVGAIMELTG